MIRRGAHGCSHCPHDHDCAVESRIVRAESSYVLRVCSVCGDSVAYKRCQANARTTSVQCLHAATRADRCLSHMDVDRFLKWIGGAR